MTTLVLFDDDCPFCRMLAELATRRADGKLEFAAWQSFRVTGEAKRILGREVLDEAADQLRVLEDGQMFAGPDAWARLLEHHPDLKSLGWIAQKLGLASQTASIINRSGHVFRRFCSRCGGRIRR